MQLYERLNDLREIYYCPLKAPLPGKKNDETLKEPGGMVTGLARICVSCESCELKQKIRQIICKEFLLSYDNVKYSFVLNSGGGVILHF